MVLLSSPTHQVGVDASQKGSQPRTVEPAVVVHPAPHDRIDPRRVRQVRVAHDATATGGPGPIAVSAAGLTAGMNEDKIYPSFPKLAPRAAERIAKERERGVLGSATPLPSLQ